MSFPVLFDFILPFIFAICTSIYRISFLSKTKRANKSKPKTICCKTFNCKIEQLNFYRKDTEPIYHYFMYSLISRKSHVPVSIHSMQYILACYIRKYKVYLIGINHGNLVATLSHFKQLKLCPDQANLNILLFR